MGELVHIARRRLAAVVVQPVEVKAGRAAVAAVPVDAAVRELDAEWQALADRRELRRARTSGPRRQHRCGACHRFIRNPNRPCPSCGYLDGAGYAA